MGNEPCTQLAAYNCTGNSLMSSPSGKKDSGWILLAWGLNGLGILALAGILVFYLPHSSANAAVESVTGTPAPRPTRTAVPTSYYLPTVTPNPQATEIEDYSTPTPFVFTTDNAPRLIGYSVLNRPINR